VSTVVVPRIPSVIRPTRADIEVFDTSTEYDEYIAIKMGDGEYIEKLSVSVHKMRGR
jgi:hypothetical protein